MQKHYRTFLFLLGLSVLLEAVIISCGFYSISADDSSRSIIAYNLLLGKLPPDLDWLPVHSLINASALFIYNDLFWTPRIISIVFGILSLIAVYQLANELFHDERIIKLTFLIAVFYPIRVLFSVTPLTEIMFTFFVTEAFVYFLRWYRGKIYRHLLISSLFFTLSAGVRYEGWLFSFAFVLAVVILYKKEFTRIPLQKLVYVFLVVSAMPVLWMCIHWLYYGNPFSFVSGPHNLYENLTHGSILLRMKYNFVTNFVFQVLAYLIFPGLVFLIRNFKKNATIKLFLIIWSISVFIIALMSVTGHGNPSHAFWRVPFAWTFLLIPFMAAQLIQWSDQKHIPRMAGLIIVIVFLPLFYLSQIYFLTKNSPFSVSEKRTGDYLASQIEKKPFVKILIEPADWNYLHVEVASRHPECFVYETNEQMIRPHTFNFTKTSLSDLIKDKNVSFIAAYNRNSEKMILDYGLTKVQSFNQWSIFKVK